MKKAVKPLLIGSGIAVLGAVAAGVADLTVTEKLVKIALPALFLSLSLPKCRKFIFIHKKYGHFVKK